MLDGHVISLSLFWKLKRAVLNQVPVINYWQTAGIRNFDNICVFLLFILR